MWRSVHVKVGMFYSRVWPWSSPEAWHPSSSSQSSLLPSSPLPNSSQASIWPSFGNLSWVSWATNTVIQGLIHNGLCITLILLSSYNLSQSLQKVMDWVMEWKANLILTPVQCWPSSLLQFFNYHKPFVYVKYSYNTIHSLGWLKILQPVSSRVFSSGIMWFLVSPMSHLLFWHINSCKCQQGHNGWYIASWGNRRAVWVV